MRGAGERIPAGDRGSTFPKNCRTALLLEGGLDFQPVSLLGEKLWWGTTLYLFFFFLSSFFFFWFFFLSFFLAF